VHRLFIAQLIILLFFSNGCNIYQKTPSIHSPHSSALTCRASPYTGKVIPVPVTLLCRSRIIGRIAETVTYSGHSPAFGLDRTVYKHVGRCRPFMVLSEPIYILLFSTISFSGHTIKSVEGSHRLYESLPSRYGHSSKLSLARFCAESFSFTPNISITWSISCSKQDLRRIRNAFPSFTSTYFG
jgi:hypothetical protein